MTTLNGLLLTLPLLFVCASCGSFAYTLPKCSIYDNECIRRSYQQVIVTTTTGIPEFNIPPLDPLQVTNISLVLFESLTFNVTRGVVKGMGNCLYQNFSVDIEKSTAFQEVKCDVLYLIGDVLVSGTGDFLKILFGTNEIKGHGNGKIKLEKVDLSYVFSFTPVRRDDGEFYFEAGTESIHYKYNIEKATFDIKHLSLNNFKEDFSNLITGVLNEGWKPMLKSVESTLMNVVNDIYFSFAKKFYDSVPVKKLVIEDLTPYVKN